jgi:hypothetical protein
MRCRERSVGVLRSMVPQFAAVTMFTFLAACGGANDEPEPSRCERLRERMLDVSLNDVVAEREQHRAALSAATSDFVATCAERLTEQQISCGLAADTLTALAACTNGGR